MDIYTAIGEDNIKTLIRYYMQKYFDDVFGIHAIYKINDLTYFSFKDFFDYVCNLDNGFYIDEFIDNMGYYYINKCIKHFIDICPFDVLYPKQL